MSGAMAYVVYMLACLAGFAFGMSALVDAIAPMGGAL